MALISGWLPPNRENWELITWAWQFFPLLTFIQWLIDFYPQGKTSIVSRLNIPGPLAWAVMESPGVLIVLYCMTHPPTSTPPSPAHWTMAALYTIHYIYRAWLSPLYLNPSMSPIHPIVFIAAAIWQTINGLALGGWLAGHGDAAWGGRIGYVQVGLVLWAWGFLGNVFHDDDLREIRRAAARRMRREGKSDGATAKVYMMPKNGLFHYVLYAHYLCEWVEWAGFWMVAGWGCVPARCFLLNEISTMLPRALAGRRWYLARFGEARVNGRKAVIPGLL